MKKRRERAAPPGVAWAHAALFAVALVVLWQTLAVLTPFTDPVFRAFVAHKGFRAPLTPSDIAFFVAGPALAAIGLVAAGLFQDRFQTRARLTLIAGAAGAARLFVTVADTGNERYIAASLALGFTILLVTLAGARVAALRQSGLVLPFTAAWAVTAAFAAFGATVDVTLAPRGVIGAGLLAAVLVALAAATPRETRAAIPPQPLGVIGAVRAVAVGAAVFLLTHIYGNAAHAARWLDTSYPAALALIAVGVVAGAWLASVARVTGPFAVACAVAPVLAAVTLPLGQPALASVLVMVSAGAVAGVAGAALDAAARDGRAGGAFWGVALVIMFGLATFHSDTFARAPRYFALGDWAQAVVFLTGAALFAPAALGFARSALVARGSKVSWVAVAAVAAVAVGAAALPTPVATPPALGDDVVVVTFNVHHGVGPAGLVDWHAIAAAIADTNASIVLLQEVEAGRFSRTGSDGAVAVARELGLHAAFAATAGRSSGNAVLSRFPVLESDTVMLPSDGLQRAAARARLDLGGGAVLDAYSVHLGFNANERVEQGGVLSERIVAARVPALVAGDFNPWGFDAGGLALEAIGMHRSQALVEPTPPPTFTVANPRASIDFVYASPEFTFTAHRVLLEQRVSDHFPVVATMRFSG